MCGFAMRVCRDRRPSTSCLAFPAHLRCEPNGQGKTCHDLKLSYLRTFTFPHTHARTQTQTRKHTQECKRKKGKTIIFPPKRLADIPRHDAGHMQFSAQYPEEHHGQEEQRRRRSYKVHQLRLAPEYRRAAAAASDAAAVCNAAQQHEEINLSCLLVVEGGFKGLGDEPIFRGFLHHLSEFRRGACCFGTVSAHSCTLLSSSLSPLRTENRWQGGRRTAPSRPNPFIRRELLSGSRPAGSFHTSVQTGNELQKRDADARATPLDCAA
jgi:hypothetical protein